MEYVAELRRLTGHCKFKAYLEDALRGHFVCGLINESIQNKLLTEVGLMFKKTVAITENMEAATENARSCKTPTVGQRKGIQNCKLLASYLPDYMHILNNLVLNK